MQAQDKRTGGVLRNSITTDLLLGPSLEVHDALAPRALSLPISTEEEESGWVGGWLASTTAGSPAPPTGGTVLQQRLYLVHPVLPTWVVLGWGHGRRQGGACKCFSSS